MIKNSKCLLIPRASAAAAQSAAACAAAAAQAQAAAAAAFRSTFCAILIAKVEINYLYSVSSQGFPGKPREAAISCGFRRRRARRGCCCSHGCCCLRAKRSCCGAAAPQLSQVSLFNCAFAVVQSDEPAVPPPGGGLRREAAVAGDGYAQNKHSQVH